MSNARASGRFLVAAKMNVSLFPVLAVLLLAAAMPAEAQVYRWKDSEGRIHYGDKPPELEKAKPVATPGMIGGGAEVTAAAEVRVTETVVDWFPIRGTTQRQMRDSMTQTAPYSEKRKSHVWGQCRWWFEWDFKYLPGPTGGCRVAEFTLTLNARMKLPKWVDANQADRDLRTRWDAFEQRLRQHEDGHKNNGIKAANDLARRIKAIGEFPDCAQLNAEIKKVGDRVWSEYALLDDAFDRVDLLYLTGF
jgi:predicted secreted Zn-dependent protease